MTGNNCDDSETFNEYIFLGYLGAFMLALGPSYQSIKIWRTQRSLDISMRWCLNYIIALTFVISYLSYEKALPVLIGNSVELLNVIIMVSLKVYFEEKFLCLEWNGKPEIIKMNLNDFAKVASRDAITFSMDYDEIYNLLEKSNDEDDIFLLTITRDDINTMELKMDQAPYIEDVDIKNEETHRKIHDSDEEFSDHDEIVYPITDP
jgi:uncharacterized protein with PQ loop repeat